jgi:hypothetical protein
MEETSEICLNIYGAPSKLAIVNKNRLLTINVKDLVEGNEKPPSWTISKPMGLLQGSRRGNIYSDVR